MASQIGGSYFYQGCLKKIWNGPEDIGRNQQANVHDFEWHLPISGWLTPPKLSMLISIMSMFFLFCRLLFVTFRKHSPVILVKTYCVLSYNISYSYSVLISCFSVCMCFDQEVRIDLLLPAMQKWFEMRDATVFLSSCIYNILYIPFIYRCIYIYTPGIIFMWPPIAWASPKTLLQAHRINHCFTEVFSGKTKSLWTSSAKHGKSLGERSIQLVRVGGNVCPPNENPYKKQEVGNV